MGNYNYIYNIITNSELIKALAESCASRGGTLDTADMYNDLLVIEAFVELLHDNKIITDEIYENFLKATRGEKFSKKYLNDLCSLIVMLKPELSDFANEQF